ncbi:hypothetical protein TSAR_000540 [Trichomalopsis sarcophagae]|uniref:Uncharacterized protein n=1 Tax=Trichomalopsis sarcophagae TaxID=543379 RepID=A0A232EFX2_9HYME|nr:hypothetical protein TSAR_000540 [Trichomalopsis sarcophagae]
MYSFDGQKKRIHWRSVARRNDIVPAIDTTLFAILIRSLASSDENCTKARAPFWLSRSFADANLPRDKTSNRAQFDRDRPVNKCDTPFFLPLRERTFSFTHRARASSLTVCVASDSSVL